MSEWYETAKRPPTEKDGVGEVLDVCCASPHYTGSYVYRAIPWHMVAEFPHKYPLWQPITPPEPPEEKAYQEWWDNPERARTLGMEATSREAFRAGAKWQKEQGK